MGIQISKLRIKQATLTVPSLDHPPVTLVLNFEEKNDKGR